MGTHIATQTSAASLAVVRSGTDPKRLHLAVTCPIELRLREMRTEYHPFLRPFDRIIRAHGKTVGRVTFVMLFAGRGWPILIPFSFSVAGNAKSGGHPWIGRRRIVVFPGWGRSRLTKEWTDQPRVLENAHHISIDAVDGAIGTHYTESRTGIETPWHESKKIILDRGDAVLVSSLFVRRPQALDLAGTAITTFENVNGMTAEQYEDRLSESLAKEHPLLTLPRGPKWDRDHHLRMNLILTGGGALVDKDYPILFGVFPSLEEAPRNEVWGEREMRYTNLPLLPTANLVVGYGIFPGRLKKDLYVF